MTGSLFGEDPKTAPQVDPQAPLAERLRPVNLDDLVGQEHLVGPGRFLRAAIERDEVPSLILWGPPGVGKTTIARIIAEQTKSRFVALSAVLSGVKDVKQVVEEARLERRRSGSRTILFVDEIHRFNKAQQDAFLPHVESGAITLIGATTENPSFEVISPLLSRSRVLVLNALEDGQVLSVLQRALTDQEKGLGRLQFELEQGVLEKIAAFANGDARSALNTLEAAARIAPEVGGKLEITSPLIQEVLQKKGLLYDKAGEEHYNLISALHKSLRNSDADASLYWLGRMLEAGEDPMYLARRMVRFASEDVGLAAPAALGLAVDTMRAVHFIGMPEGKLALAQLAVYLAQAPKSNAVYTAYKRVESAVAETRNDPVPLHLRNAPTRLMKDLGYSKGYRYAHDEAEGVSNMPCLPPNLQDSRFFQPTDQGFESEVKKRLREIEKLRAAAPPVEAEPDILD